MVPKNKKNPYLGILNSRASRALRQALDPRLQEVSFICATPLRSITKNSTNICLAPPKSLGHHSDNALQMF